MDTTKYDLRAEKFKQELIQLDQYLTKLKQLDKAGKLKGDDVSEANKDFDDDLKTFEKKLKQFELKIGNFNKIRLDQDKRAQEGEPFDYLKVSIKNEELAHHREWVNLIMGVIYLMSCM